MSDLADRFAGEIRAHLARRGMTATEFARVLGETPVWVSRRLSSKRRLRRFKITDAHRMCVALGLDIRDVITAAESTAAAS